MGGQAEVVVRAEQYELAAVDDNGRLLTGFDLAQRTRKAGVADRGQLGGSRLVQRDGR